MNISLIKDIIQNKRPSILDSGKESAVLVPIIEVDHEIHLLFEVRSLSLNSQPGEICFPGGKIEQGESPLDCAIRETSEELNICKSKIEIVNKLAHLTTLSNMTIHSYCGVLKKTDLNSIDFNKDEVASIFSVPVRDLLAQDPICGKMKINLTPSKDFPFHLIEDGESYKWQSGIYPVYFYEYKDHIIWGITAKILKNFLDILKFNL